LLSIIILLIANKEYVVAEQGEFQGITEPYRDSILGAYVTGVISVIKRKEGEFVKKGEVILELESQQEALEVERRKLIAESKVEVKAAKDRVKTLELELESTRKLFEETQSVSKEELQKKELEYKLAQAELERLLLAEKREEIEYKIAQVQLEKRRITAPFDGIIVKVYHEVGENCNPQEPLVRIVDIRKCRFIAYVENKISSYLKAGMKVTLRIQSLASPFVCQGIIEYVSPVVDPSSGLREVKVVFDNPDNKIQPGVTGIMVLQVRGEVN